MKVQDIMTAAPLTCTPHTNLAEAVNLMWQGDCGILPVVNSDGTLAGVITDRDISIAAATRDRSPSQMRAGDLTGTEVVCCKPGDDVAAALNLMGEKRVRRLPVVGTDGSVVGVLALNDVILEAVDKSDVTAGDVVRALKSISAHHHPLTGRPSQAPVAVQRRPEHRSLPAGTRARARA